MRTSPLSGSPPNSLITITIIHNEHIKSILVNAEDDSRQEGEDHINHDFANRLEAPYMRR